MDEADRMANRVAIIDHGKLLVLDTPAALKQRLGQGDTVEIKLENGLADSPADSLANSQAAEAKARLALQDIASDVKLEAQANILHVRALHALGRLADILQALTAPDSTRARSACAPTPWKTCSSSSPEGGCGNETVECFPCKFKGAAAQPVGSAAGVDLLSRPSSSPTGRSWAAARPITPCW